MKNIIFLEGVHGAGKTTLSIALKISIEREFYRRVVLLNNHEPEYYKNLINIDKKYKINNSNPLAKVSYRAARINMGLEIEVRSRRSIAIFDRGPISMLCDGRTNTESEKILMPFMEELFSSYADYGILIVFLRPSFHEITSRINERLEKVAKELNRDYLKKYYDDSYQYFIENNYNCNCLELNSEVLTVNEMVDKVLEIMKK